MRCESVTRVRRQFAERRSDLRSLLDILGAYQCYPGESACAAFCKAHFVRRKNMSECTALLRQLQYTVQGIYTSNSKALDIHLPRALPSAVQQILLRRIISAGLMDQMARRWPDGHVPDAEDWSESRRGHLMLKRAYQCMVALRTPVFIHPASYLLCGGGDEAQPEMVMYYALYSSGEGKEKRKKRRYMRMVTAVELHWAAVDGAAAVRGEHRDKRCGGRSPTTSRYTSSARARRRRWRSTQTTMAKADIYKSLVALMALYSYYVSRPEAPDETFKTLVRRGSRRAARASRLEHELS